MSLGGLSFFIVFGVGMFLLVRAVRRDGMAQDNSPQYYYDEQGNEVTYEEYEEEQDELDDDEIAYFVSEGWRPEDGLPPNGFRGH